MLSTSTSLSLAAIAMFATQAAAHMSIWHPSMYGVGPGWSYDAGDPVAPLGPNWSNRDDWWFRGPGFRSLPPQSGAVLELPAGGSVELEIACHYAFSSYGYATTTPGSALDACPGPNAGPYHSGDPLSTEIDDNLLSGCALGIADVDNINDVTMDNLAIFSVQHDCVKQKNTNFEIPAKMPACTGEKCICGWFWLANNGTANFYMTGFDCKVTGSPADATPIAPPQDPVFCKNNPSSCTTGSKRPIYAYNTPSNVPWIGNNDRAGYHQSWSFGTNGAQNDIFMPAGYNVTAYKQAIGGGNAASPVPETPTGANGATDLAVTASAVASSSALGQGPYSAIDGLTGGYLADGTGNENAEWSSNGQTAGSWIKLAWSSPVNFNQIQLFDRPNLDDQVMAGNVTFADGSSILFGTLPNDGSSPLILNFASPITTSSLNLTITAVSSSTKNSGLSEIEIFSVPASSFTTSPVSVVPGPQSTHTTTTVAPMSDSASVSSTHTSAAVTTSSPVVSSASAISTSAHSSSVLSTTVPAITSKTTQVTSSSSTISKTSTPVSSSSTTSKPAASSSSVSQTSSHPATTSSSSSTSSPLAPTTSSSVSKTSSASASPSSSSSHSSSAVSSTSSRPATTAAPTTTSKSSTTATKLATTTTPVLAASPTPSLIDLARVAVATASSQLLGQPASGAIDGIVGGIVPGTRHIMHQEWTSAGQGVGAWLLLTWTTPVTFNEIVLHDRPNLQDQILGGNLTFADGTGVSFGPLANDGSATPIYLSKSVTTTSLKMYISKVSSTTTSIGLSEIMVYQVPNPRFPAASVLTPTKAPIVLAATPATTQATSSVKASSTAAAASSSSTSSKVVWYLAPQSTQVLAAVNPKATQTQAPQKRHARDFRLDA